ncbi:Yip1 family protein [Hahella sp. HN01]|uniref:Yip1 family protein n=1 Tax=Hahella sp. HN01 TaxID=2847262 RepID=UPI0021117935|nr:Yip1 family protein [Hahella sp. HN01]
MQERSPYTPPSVELEPPVTPSENERLNPWFSIWLRPRATMQQLAQSASDKSVFVMAGMAGMINMLYRISDNKLSTKGDFDGVWPWALLAGLVEGLLIVYLGSELIRWTGRLLNGRASYSDIRKAMAWSYIPFFATALFFLTGCLILDIGLFDFYLAIADGELEFWIIFIAVSAIRIVFGIWGFVVFLKCLGQVQGFSAWKALANWVMVIFVATIFIYLPLGLGFLWYRGLLNF